MSVLCPFCGNGNVEDFADTVLKTQGHHCRDCNKDFGVDDGKNFQEHEKLLTDLIYQRTLKDGTTRQITIHRIEKQVTLTPSLIQDKILSPYEKADISDAFPSLASFLFEKIFLLDWPKEMKGILTGKEDESYQLMLRFSLDLLPELSYRGTASFPPYLRALDALFAGFFPEDAK
jgi:hypothetical protein